MSNEDYGHCLFGCVFWNASVARASRFVEAGGFELRWYGITIPWTKNIGIGLLVRRKCREALAQP